MVDTQITSTPAPSAPAKKSKAWLWIVIALVVVLLVFFWMRKTPSTQQQTGTPQETPQPTPAATDEISSLDSGANPDIGVNDVDSLQTSQDNIAG